MNTETKLSDPNKVVDVFSALVNHTNPPCLLFLGTDALERAQDKIVQLIKQWKNISSYTD